MESEFSDLYDRKLISLYGMKPGRPTKMDQAGTEAQQKAEDFLNGEMS